MRRIGVVLADRRKMRLWTGAHSKPRGRAASQSWLRSVSDSARRALVMRPPYWPSSETPKSPATTACRPSRHWRKRMRRLSGLSNATPLAIRSAGRSSWSKQGEADRSNLAGVWSPLPSSFASSTARTTSRALRAQSAPLLLCHLLRREPRQRRKGLNHEYFQLRECQVADRYVDITRGTCLCS